MTLQSRARIRYLLFSNGKHCFNLTRLKAKRKGNEWLLIKKKDEYALAH